MRTKDKQHSIAWEIAPVSVLLMMIFTIALSAGGELVSLAPIIYLFLSMPMLYSMAHVTLNKPKLNETDLSSLSDNLRWLSSANKIVSTAAMTTAVLVTCALISSAITFAYTAGSSVGLHVLAGLVVGAAISDLIINVSGLISSYIKEQSGMSFKPLVFQSYGNINETMAITEKSPSAQVIKKHNAIKPVKTDSSSTLPMHYHSRHSIYGCTDNLVANQVSESANNTMNAPYHSHDRDSVTGQYQSLSLKPK